jgi:outer membrane protein TolC
VQATLDPSLSRNNIRQEFINGNTLVNPNAGQQSLNANLLLNWTLFDGTAMFTNYKRLNKFEEIGALQARAAIEQVITEVTLAYYETRQNLSQLAAAEKNLELSRERLQLVEARATLGSTSGQELLQSRVDFNADNSLVLRQQEQLLQSKIRLNQLLNRNADTDWLPVDSMPTAGVLELADLRKQAIESNTWLQLAEMQAEVAALDARLTRNAMLPRVELVSGYHINRLQSEAGFLASNQNRGLDLGLRAGITVFDGGRLNRDRKNAAMFQANALLAEEREKQVMDALLLSSFVAYENNRKLIQMEAENLDIAQQNVNIAREAYRVGSISALALREAQQQLLVAESRLMDAQFAAALHFTSLQRLSGQLIR